MVKAVGCSVTAACCMHKGPSPPRHPRNLVSSLPNALKSALAGWKKQPLIMEISKSVKSIPLNLLDRFVDSTYKFSDQPVLNESGHKVPPRKWEFDNYDTSLYLVWNFTPEPTEFSNDELNLMSLLDNGTCVYHPEVMGNFGPVDEIGEAVLLDDIDGEVPKDFPEGVYIRNGPNPLGPTQITAKSIFGSTSYMYYEGHGMLHAVYFDKGSRGEWRISYKNKYVDSETFQLEREGNKPTFIPSVDGQPYGILVAFILNILRFGKPVKDSGNTSIFEHAGRAFAVTENHLPYEIDITNLNTVGPYDVNGAWDRPFTSHPKKVQQSGELVMMGTNTEKPYYVVGVISSDGKKLLHKVDLKFEEGKLIHDIGITEKYNIIMDYPLRFGIFRTFWGKQFIQNDIKGRSRIGVMPRFGNVESVVWFDVENHCSYHLFNCFEDGNEVVVRGCRTLGSVIPGADHNADKSQWYQRAFLPPNKNSTEYDPSLDGILFSRPYEWRLSMTSGLTKEGYLTSEQAAMDFPIINGNFVGIKNKYGYAQVVDSVASSKTGLIKYKMIAKLHFDIHEKDNEHLIAVDYHVLEDNHFCSGVQFVARKNSTDEDDGWIITFVHDEKTNISKVYIIDAKKFTEEPEAKITLPQRVPYGFHGNFFNK